MRVTPWRSLLTRNIALPAEDKTNSEVKNSVKSETSFENLTFEDRILRLKTKSKLSEADHEA